MLGKLIRHEFHATSRMMLPLYLGALLLGVFSKVFVYVTERPQSVTILSGVFMRILAGLVTFLAILALIFITVFSVVLMVYRFYKNLMTDEGYLMFTLPVSTHQLIWAKLLVSAVWFIGTILLDLLGVLILTWHSRNTPDFLLAGWNALSRFAGSYPLDLAFFLVEGFAALLLAMLLGCLSFYTPIAIGHSFDNHKVLLSVVFYFVLHLVLQICGIAAVISGFRSLSQYSLYGVGSVLQLCHILLISGILAELVIGAVLYVVTYRMLRKHLNLA